jgi:hypothetical protein
MENYDYYLSGEIHPVIEKEKKEKNKMQYIAKKIKDEINSKFKNDKNIYIYYRFSKQKVILKIFIILLGNKKYNKRNIDITYLVKVSEDYPNIAPLVFCLTSFNKNLDIFDMRNIQTNLLPEWSNLNTINDLIIQMPIFIDDLDYQVKNKLLPISGEYYLYPMTYDLNDFFLNNDNKFFKVKILSGDENDQDKIKLIPMYIIITKFNLLFFKSVFEKTKNFCKIKYVINLIGIERLRRFLKEGKIFKGLAFFKIVSNKYTNKKTKIFDKTICVEDNNLMINEINELIESRKAEIAQNFKFFENLECNGIKEIENIIKIKQNIVKNKVDENIFFQIHNLYNKLIEICSDEDENNYSKYVKKLQMFLDNYEKMKNGESNPKIDKEDKDNNYYNFGFEE